MGRTVKNRRTYQPTPVRKIEVSEENTKKRGLAAVLFLIIGVALLVYCFVVFINPDPGWTTIEANRTVNDSSEFVFQYYLGADGANANDENRAVTALYNQASEKAFRLFHDKESFENVVNIYEINRSPNTELEVDEALYKVFSLFKSSGSRYLYIAPIYSRYDDIFSCFDDSMLSDFDPLSSEDIKEEYKAAAEYVNDPEMIDMQLLGDNKIKLFVSEKYLEYAEKEGISDFISLSWLKNAFEADFLAETMIKNGFTHGSFSSHDGFIRNLDGGDTDYSFNIFDQREDGIYQAAVMRYKGPESIVFLRAYALNELDAQHYYRLRSGEVRTPYIDVKDGIPKNALDNLVCCSTEKGCAEMLLEIIDIYISESFERDRLSELSDKGIYSVYCDEDFVMYNDEELIIDGLYNSGGVEYKAKLFK